MRIIIVGAGAVGTHLADRLSKENHDVTVIEQDKERLRSLQDDLDILTVAGNGASPRYLEEAGIANCDLMMALTNSDETNLVASLSAAKNQVPFKIARVSNMDYYLLDNWLSLNNLGVDLLVNPEFECALQISKLLNVPGAAEVAEFAGGRVVFLGLEVKEGAPGVGEALEEITRKRDKLDFLVGSITRGNRTIIPSGETRLEVGDTVFCISLADALDDVYHFVGRTRNPVHRVMILGGSKVAVYLSKMLERKKITATLIVNDEERAEELAEELDNTLVVQGEPTNVELWALEGLTEIDAFLALTRDDEENMLSGLIARNHDVRVVMALLEKLSYVPLVNKVGVNTAVSSRLAIVDSILKYVRRGNILSLATLKNNEAEIIEFLITDKCKLLGKPIKDIKKPRDILFGMVSREKDVFIPTGYTQFQVEDRVICVTGPNSRQYLERMFL